MTGKHTPGPWKAVHRSDGAGPNDDEIAGLGWDIEGPPQPMRGQFALAADAHLAAAAPETAAHREILRSALVEILHAQPGQVHDIAIAALRATGGEGE